MPYGNLSQFADLKVAESKGREFSQLYSRVDLSIVFPLKIVIFHSFPVENGDFPFLSPLNMVFLHSN